MGPIHFINTTPLFSQLFSVNTILTDLPSGKWCGDGSGLFNIPEPVQALQVANCSQVLLDVSPQFLMPYCL